MQLALPDDVVQLVFAKLDFADLTLYATYRHSNINFMYSFINIYVNMQVCVDIKTISQSSCHSICYKH
jgi:hypothetical protein